MGDMLQILNKTSVVNKKDTEKLPPCPNIGIPSQENYRKGDVIGNC